MCPIRGPPPLYAPIASNNGAAITGLVRSGYIANEAGESRSLGDRAMFAYPVADGTEASAQLTVRDLCNSARRPVPREQWTFARLEKASPPDAARARAGLEPGKITR
jgi:hypothetical protein